MRRALMPAVVAASLPAPAIRAQDWTGYEETSLDAIVARWDEITRKEKIGVTIMEPQSVHLVVRYAAVPKPCNNGLLRTIFAMNGRKEVPERIPMTHCVMLASAKGRSVAAYIQDTIVPGLEKDGKLGGQIEVYAVLVGYLVKANRAENYPVLVVNRFEPK